MATKWISPTWRMPEQSNQSKFENYSLEFNGTNDEIDCAATYLNAVSNFSISTWFTTDSVANADKFLINIGSSSSELWGVQLYQGDLIVYGGSNIKYFRYNGHIATGQWYNLVVSYNGSESASDKYKVYLNGSLLSTSSISGTIDTVTPTFTTNLVIGKLAYSAAAYWNGKITEVAIYDSTLTSDPITALYNSGTPVNPMALTPLPVAYYPLGGSSTGSASTLTIPNESVPSATVFDFEQSSSQNIDIGSSTLFDSSSAFSFSTWCKLESYDNGFPAFIRLKTDQSTGFIIAFSDISSQYYGVVFGSDSNFLRARTSGNISADLLGVWKHICLVYDGVDRTSISSYSLYIDGDVQSLISAGNFAATPNTNVIGQGNTASTFWDGLLSNVQVWNAELETADVTTLYNNGVPYTGTQPQAANLKGWWKMNVDTSTWNGSDWVIGDARTSYNKCLNFPTQTDNFKYDSFNFNGKSEISFSFWYNHHVTVNSNDKILGTKDTIYWAFAANQNRSGLGGSVSLTIKTGDNASSNTAEVMIPNVTDADSGWNLLTGTYDGSNFRGYLNGVQVGSDQAITGNLMSSTGAGSRDLNVTVRDGAGAVMAGMKISNFVMWDKGLTSPEVATLFNGGIPFTQKSDFPQQGNMSLWNTLTDMNTSSGGGVFDNSGNGVVITSPSNPPVSFDLLVSALNGLSDSMTTANLVNSDLTRSIPYSSYSMVFDGTADYITVPQNVLTDFTVSFWINPSTTSGANYDGILGAGTTSAQGGILRYVAYDGNTSVGNVNLYLGGGWVTVTSLTNGIWSNVILTYDSTADEFKSYKNGILDTTIASPDFSGQTTDAHSFVEIGRRNGTDGTCFAGKISNVSLFNSALNQDQMLTIYNGGVPNSLSSLSPVSWWSLAGDSYYNGSDWICPDLGSGGNNGTSSGMGGTELVGDGPGSTANGIATSMDIPANLKGNAPNSSKNAFSINMNSADRVEDVAPTPPLLLDAYGTNIGGAYSFRKLSSTYSGNCIRVRRSSDDAEADIGFDGNYLDESALLAHTGTGGSDDGFITKWYDQSGAFVGTPSAINDGDLAQSTTTNQPRIVKNGVIVKGSGLVKAGDIARPYLSNPAAAGSGNGWITDSANTQDLAIFCVAYPTDTNTYDAWFGCATYGGTERGCIGINNSGTAPRYLTLRTQDGTSYTQLTGTTPIAYDTFAVGTAVLKASPATTSLSLNGVSQGTLTNWTNSFFNKLAWPGAASGYSPDAAEFLIYQTPPSASDIAGIEANIINYYGIS